MGERANKKQKIVASTSNMSEITYDFEREFIQFREALNMLCELRLENIYQKTRFIYTINTKIEELRGDKSILSIINQSTREIDLKIGILEAIRANLE